MGADFRNNILEVEPGVRVQLQIWDVTGNDVFW